MGMNTAAVQRLYVAYFNRPADPVSLAVYEAQLPTDRVATQAELLVVAEASFSPSAEFTTNFADKSNSQIVNQLYQNIFGRDAEAAGLIGWATQLTDGSTTVAELALQLSYSAQGTDAAVVDARIEAATTFTSSLDTAEEITGYSGDAAAAQGRAYLAQISGALPTTDEAIATQKDTTITNVDVSIAAAVAAGNAVAGTTFQLTTAVETVTGTKGDDTIQGSLIGDIGTGTTSNPSDTLNAGDGTDAFQLSVSGEHAANFTLSGMVSSGLETLNINNFETNNARLTTIDASLLAGLTGVSLTSSAASGDTTVSNLGSIVTGSMANGSANLTLGYSAAAIAGATSQTLNLNGGVTAATATIAGVEAVTVNSANSANTLTDLVTANATTLTLTGDQNLSISAGAAVDFDFADAALATAVDGTVDATGLFGTLSINMNANDVVTVLGGSASMTLGMGAGLTAADTITGGAGAADLIEVTGSETTALPLVTGVEALQITVADIDIADGGAGDAAGAVTLSGAAIASVTNYVSAVTTATDGDVGTVNVTGMDDGDTVTIAAGGSDTTAAGAAAGISLATTFTTDSASNSATIAFNGIGAVNADASQASGFAQVEVDEVETLTLTANTNAAGTVTTSGVEVLTAQAATSITATGSAALAVTAVTNTTLLTSIDASGMLGNLTLAGVDASVLNYKGTQGNDTLSLGGVTNADTFDGNGGTDAITATGVTGLTATTGVLNVTDVDDLILNTTGANTVDTSSMTDVGEIVFTGNHAGTQTVTNLGASGTTITLGSAAATMDGGAQINVSLADETGGTDTLAVTLNNAAAASTDTELDFEAIESLTIAVGTTTTNNAIVDLTNAEANNVTVTGGAAGALLTFGATDALTNNINLTGYLGEVSFTAAAATDTGGVTLNASSAAAADNYTLSAFSDTATIATTGAVDVDINMGAGTGDVLNLTVTTGFIDTGEIDGVETINLGVVAGADIVIGANATAATDADGISEATSVVLTGGNELSTFTVGSGGAAAAADTISGTTLTTFNASGFSGNIDLEYAVEMPATLTVSAGALATDVVRTTYNAGGTDILLGLTGVERFIADLDTGNDGGETYTFDLGSSTGVTRLEFGAGTIDTTTLVVDSYTSGTTIQLGTTIANAVQEFSGNVDVNMVNSAGATDVLNVRLQDTDDSAQANDLDAAGIETLNIALTTDAESHTFSLAGVTPTAGSAGTINISGGVATDGLVISDVGAGVTTINASTLVGTLTISDRPSTAIAITGGSAGDNLRMENGGDAISAGTGTDTLSVVQNAVLGGFAIDLSSTTDQLTTYNGASNSAVQVGFENVDLSGVTGTFGADITAQSGATTVSVMAGTPNVDNITLGTGTDNVRYNAANLTASDSINSWTTGTDNIELTTALFVGGNQDYQEAAAIAAGANAAVTVATTALANDAAIVTAIRTSVDATDTLFIVANTADGEVQAWYDADPNADGGEVQVATFVGVGVGDVAATFQTADFTYVA
jgi:hypothetical protein